MNPSSKTIYTVSIIFTDQKLRSSHKEIPIYQIIWGRRKAALDQGWTANFRLTDPHHIS